MTGVPALGRTVPATRLYRLPSSGQRNTAAGIFVGSLAGVVGGLVLILWTGTQWAAWKLAYQPALGPPLFAPSAGLQAWLLACAIVAGGAAIAVLTHVRTRRLSPALFALALVCAVCAFGPVYAPWDFFVWELRYGHVVETEPIWRTGHWLIGVPAHLIFLVGVVLAVRRARKIGGHTDSHGSARWAQAEEIEATGLLQPAGVYVGGWAHRGRTLPLRHDGPQHVLGFAPARSGKGVGWVLPTLLTWPHSVLVNDIKGENWALTAGWRRHALGTVCLKFDPTCDDGSAARYNPLLEVRKGPKEIRDVQNIADILVDPDGDGGKDHWDLTAQEILAGTILHVLYAGPKKSLRGCLDLLTDPQRKIDDVLQDMIKTEHDPSGAQGWRHPTTGKPTRTHPAVARAARALLNKSENERSSVLSSATKFLSLYHDDLVAENTAACDFSITDLMHHERPVSLYLTVPPSDLSRVRPLVRLLINQIGRRLTERMDFEEGRPTPHYRHRLLLMLDEFATLGRLDFFQTQLSYLPGYGIRAFLIVQDLSQLYAAYGRDESIVSNCDIRVAYAPNKVETARLLSDMAGAMTVHKETRTYTGNRLNPVLMHVLASEQESQRPLLTPDEALRLPPDAALVFVSGSRPILGRKLHYFRDPRFAERARIPAPATSDRLPHDACTWATPDDLIPAVPTTTKAQPESTEAPPDSPPTDAAPPDDEALLADSAPAGTQ
jgi:type IV secretion system protein VirD4